MPRALDRRMKPTHISMVLAALLFSSTAQCEPVFARYFKQQYGYPPSCNACHKDGGGTPLNGYGEQFKSAGMKLSSFDQIAGLDGDADGHANGEEAIAKANPGSEKSTPADKGNWLDIASLIPLEVQKLFPGIRSYLPKDALLTEADIERAGSMGAILSSADENTIYIPLVDRRPAGTAIIFSAEYGGKSFFLLLATDRKLQITTVQALNTSHVPEAANHQIYAAFEGLSLDQLPDASGDDVGAAISKAVKKAGTLVYVRLKSA